MPTPYEKTPQTDAFVALIQRMQTDIRNLQSGTFRVPVLDADPGDKTINLWYLSDGRLRGRHPLTNAIFEFTKGTPGASTSTTPRTAASNPATIKQKTYTCTWSASYTAAGVLVDSNIAAFGMAPGATDNRQALLGVPPELITDLVGTTPTMLEIAPVVRDTTNTAAISVPLQYGTNYMTVFQNQNIPAQVGTTPPPTYPIVNNFDAAQPTIVYRNPLDTGWVNITSAAALNALSRGLVRSIAVSPGNVNTTSYGEIASASNPFGAATQIRVTYYS